MASLLSVDLWAGLVEEECCQKEARLRLFTGEDEAALLDSVGQRLPAEQTTWLLTRLLERIGETHPVNEDHVRRLTVGDRDRLLFALCAATFSSEMDLVVRCPFEECGELTESSFSLSPLTSQIPKTLPSEFYEKLIALEQGEFVLRFRFPTGLDQENACLQLQEQGSSIVEEGLLRSCILELRNKKDEQVEWGDWLAEISPHLESAWAELDPSADCYSGVECPACGRSYSAVLDPLSLFMAGLENRGNIFQQVDRLARAYHWSERELMALPFRRRQQYLDLVDSNARRS